MVKGRDVAIIAGAVGLGLYAWQKRKAEPTRVAPPPLEEVQRRYYYDALMAQGWIDSAAEYARLTERVTDPDSLYKIYMDVYQRAGEAPAPTPAPTPTPTPVSGWNGVSIPLLNQIRNAVSKNELTRMYNNFTPAYQSGMISYEFYLTLYQAYVTRWGQVG